MALSKPQPHVWGPAPPGQGSQPTCRRCGIRMSVAKAQPDDQGENCPGTAPDQSFTILPDYEPIP